MVFWNLCSPFQRSTWAQKCFESDAENLQGLSVRGDLICFAGFPIPSMDCGIFTYILVDFLGAGFKHYWFFVPYLGKCSDLTNTFQMG